MKLCFSMTTPRHMSQQRPGWLPIPVPTWPDPNLLLTRVRIRLRHLLCDGVCRLIRWMTLLHTPGNSAVKVRLLSLYPTAPTFSSRVSGVQTLSALCDPPRRPLLGTYLTACTPRSWLVSPTISIWTLWVTVMITPCIALVVDVLLHRIPLSPAILLMRCVILLLKLLCNWVSGQVALLIALRRSVVVRAAGATLSLVRTAVMVRGRATHGLLS